MSFAENPRAVLGGNYPPEDDELTPEDLPTADLINRVVGALAATMGKLKERAKVLKKKQQLDILSVRQVAVYCLTHDNPDLAIIPLVKLAKCIGFDRGTVRDDRKAVEAALKQFPEMSDALESCQDITLSVAAVAPQAPTIFINMDIARSKSRERARKLLAEKRERQQVLAQPTRGETALRELGMDDLADQLAEQRVRAPPWNPSTDARPQWLGRNQ